MTAKSFAKLAQKSMEEKMTSLKHSGRRLTPVRPSDAEALGNHLLSPHFFSYRHHIAGDSI